jgi:hypothetical protein
LQAFKGLVIPHRLHMVLAGSAADWTAQDLSPDAENTYLHETVHWWQTAMTGYGHSAWSLFRQSTAFSIAEWVKGTDSTPKLAADSHRATQARRFEPPRRVSRVSSSSYCLH